MIAPKVGMTRVLNNRPIVFLVFFFAVGVALAYYAGFVPIAAVIGAVASATLAVVWICKKKGLCFLYIMAFFLGALLFCVQYPTDFKTVQDERTYDVSARVSNRELGDYTRYTLSDIVLSDDGETIVFDKDAYLYSRETLDYGDLVQFQTKVDIPDGVRNPNTLDETMYLAANGVGFSCFATEVLVTGNRTGWYALPLMIREAIAEKIEQYYTSETAPIAQAMFLGVRSRLSDTLQKEFSVTGISHVLAISGLHIAIIAAAFNFLLKKLRVSRNARFSINIAVLVGYALLTGLAPSVVRAVIMTAFLLIGRWKFAKRDVLTFLSAAMGITLIFNTAQLFMPGFLMSYGVVFGLLCLLPACTRLFEKIRFQNKFSSMLSASCAASVTILPLTAYYFKGISLGAPLVNFFAIPLTIIIVVCTGIFSVFAFIAPPAAAVLSFVPQVAASLLVFLNSVFATTGFGYIAVADFPVWVCFAVVAIIFLCSDYVLIKRKLKLMLAGVLCAVVVLGLALPAMGAREMLRITVLDVGTGDAVHLQTKNNDWLVDNGGTLQRSKIADYTEASSLVYDKAVITNDRTNNLRELIEKGEIDQLCVPVNYVPKDHDDKIELNCYQMYDRMYMEDDVFIEPIASDGKNSSFAIYYNGRVVCVLAQNEAEDLEEDGRQSPVIKLANGGGAGSVSQKMLDDTDCETAIISVGENNSRNLPDADVLKLLRGNGVEIHTTADKGAVVITVYEDGGIQVTTMRRE